MADRRTNWWPWLLLLLLIPAGYFVYVGFRPGPGLKEPPAPAAPLPQPSRGPSTAPTRVTSLPATQTLTSAKVAAPPVLDGKVEPVWNNAGFVRIPVSGGYYGNGEVLLRSVYTADSIYFLAEWQDSTESLRRQPWLWDGARWVPVPPKPPAYTDWARMPPGAAYEDKLSLIWDISGNIAGFAQSGCAPTCHGTKMYTNSEGELADIWHWKSVRGNPVGQVDDQYLTINDPDSKEGGRKSDPNTGGGYYVNETSDKSAPRYVSPDKPTAPPYWILDEKKAEITPAMKFNKGDEVPGVVVARFTGDRGDIAGKGVHSDGKWVLEWGRPLNTNSKFDVQFSDLNAGYLFGVAVFDNAQIEHSYSQDPYQLVFAK